MSSKEYKNLTLVKDALHSAAQDAGGEEAAKLPDSPWARFNSVSISQDDDAPGFVKITLKLTQQVTADPKSKASPVWKVEEVRQLRVHAPDYADGHVEIPDFSGIVPYLFKAQCVELKQPTKEFPNAVFIVEEVKGVEVRCKLAKDEKTIHTFDAQLLKPAPL